MNRPNASVREHCDNSAERIYLSPPHMGGEEFGLLRDAFESNWIAPIGPHLVEFENEVARIADRNHAVALSSCTAALHLSLLIHDIGPGDEVMCSSLTFVATANAIMYTGATPVFIDSDRRTWNLDPNLLSDELARRSASGRLPKALITVDVLGQCCEYDAIVEICERYGVTLIEDAAESLGAYYRDRPAGNFGRIAAFSFNGNKILTTSGGGMLVTDDRDVAERALHLSTQARLPAAHYEHAEPGYNYRLSNLLAAIGRGQLRVLGERVDRRRAIFQTYHDAFEGLPGIEFMPEPEGYRSNRWLTAILIDPDQFGADREAVRVRLESENIESRPLWKPMHMQPMFAEAQVIGGDVSADFFNRGLCLPSGSSLSDDQIDRIVGLITSM